MIKALSSQGVIEWLTKWMLPLGVFVLLTGMMWAEGTWLYHRLFYVFIAFPVVVVALLDRSLVLAAFCSPVWRIFLLFACYALLSLLWSETREATEGLIKRPAYVAVLFLAMVQLSRYRFDLLVRACQFAAVFAVFSAVFTLVLFFLHSPSGARLAGLGALSNPLVSSHVYGFFLVLWTAFWITQKRFFNVTAMFAVGVLIALILATGSRTPLLAFAATLIWLAVQLGGRRGVGVGMALLAGVLLLGLFWSDILMQRGFSFRPDIWQVMWQYVMDKPWFGHGFGSVLSIPVEEVQVVFSDPHNLMLAVLYEMGLAGLGLWIILYVFVLVQGWQRRKEPWMLMSVATLVYGLVAGMTEGGSFLPRPKEHWFIVWIPFALFLAASLRNRNG